VTAGRARNVGFRKSEAFQFGSEMAAPVEIEDANWHRSKQLHKECGWKRGDSAIVNFENGARSFAPPVGRRSAIFFGAANTGIDIGGLLMEVARHSGVI
jgi:hypothetical protein